MTGSGAPAADGSTGSSLDAEAKAEISRLVSRALELQDGGEERWLEEACADRPDLIDEVRSAVEGASQLPGLLFGQVGVDRLLGTRLADRYEVRSRLGSGSMGVVYEAYDVELRRAVAVKLLRADLFDGLKAAERFKREAHAMAAVEHPAVIAIHDRGQTDSGESYIVMDLIDGLPLSAVVEELSGTVTNPSTVTAEIVAERLNLETHRETSYVRMVARWVAELAAGLGETHRASVVHRDIKPSNVIVRRDGRPVLVDFGIAHLTEDASITRGGTSVGTPAYMPPESLSGKQIATKAGDIYGLGALLYSLVALRPPYLGTPSEVLSALSTREPDRVERVHRGLPRDLQAIIETCMARRAGARYPDAQALEADLRAFLGHQPVTVRPLGMIRRVARRTARSRAAQGAGLMMLVGCGLVAADGWRRHHAAARLSSLEEILSAFPPGVLVCSPKARVCLDPLDATAREVRLDRAVEVADDPLATLLFRAAFRLDHGDVKGAAADMRRLAVHEGTEVARAFANAYGSLASGSSGHGALPPFDVPDPVGARDGFIVAFHGLRDFSGAGDRVAMPLLSDPEVRALPFGEELRWVLAIPDGIESPEEGERLAVGLQNDVLLREGAIGRRTASSAHWLGFALGKQRRFKDALRVVEEAIALAPRVHLSRTNAAQFAIWTGDLDAAARHASAGIEMAPTDHKLAQSRVWIPIIQADFDEARRVIQDLAPALDAVYPWWSQEMLATSETYRALGLFEASQSDVQAVALDAKVAMRRALNLAESHALQVTSILAASSAGTRGAELATLRGGIESQDRQVLFRALASLYLKDPLDWWRLDQVLSHTPAALDAESQAVQSQLVARLAEVHSSR